MTVFSVFVYFVFLLGSLVPLLENVPNIQQRLLVSKRLLVRKRLKVTNQSSKSMKKPSTAGDNVIETMMYTYHIPNRTDCNGPRLYQAYQ